jgi:hypothetical protein
MNFADLTTESEAFELKQRLIFCVIVMTELLESNVATRTVDCRYKFGATNRTLPPLGIFVSQNPCHSFTESSLWKTSVEEKMIIETYVTIFGRKTKPVTWRIQGTSVTTFRYYFNFNHVQGQTWRKAQGIYWFYIGAAWGGSIDGVLLALETTTVWLLSTRVTICPCNTSVFT